MSRQHAESPPSIVAARLRVQAGWCAQMKSPLYAELLTRAAEDVEAGGPCWELLAGHQADAQGSALGLRFLGAVHRMVLDGRIPQLAPYYPSVGGRADNLASVWTNFRGAVGGHCAVLRDLVNCPVQTNEVGRSPALLGGFLLLAREYRLPLRLLELGASGGLNLRWDWYRYEAGAAAWGNPESSVRFTNVFAGPLPPLDTDARVAERRGCDQAPVAVASAAGQLTLESYVWADQVQRLERLRAAIAIARRVPAELEEAEAAPWLERQTAAPVEGTATVVFHSIVWQYLDEPSRRRIQERLVQAGARASRSAPLAWLRMEPAGPETEIRLTRWPGFEERVIARAGFHGQPVHWLA